MLQVSREIDSNPPHLHPLISKLFPSSMRNDLIGQRQLENLNLQLNDKLAEVVHEMELRAMEKRERPKKKNIHKQEEVIVSRPAVKTIVALTTVPVGGSVMSLRDEKGHESVLIGYSRSQLVRASRSPFALLPPPTMREMVNDFPEVLSRFPRRYPLQDPRFLRMNMHSMEDD